MNQPTVVVQLSGSGRGAVATVLVDGQRAAALVAQHFAAHRPRAVQDLPVNRICLGTWTAGAAAEELVICRTNAAQFEIHCHGGRAAARNIICALVRSGADELSVDEWLLRAERDPFIRAAKRLLPAASTQKSLGILLAQVRGAMRTLLDRVLEHLQQGQIPQSLSLLQRCLDFSDVGRHLTAAWKVVVAGPPNSGKSRLINGLLGYERSVVFDQPGTTRDVVAASMAIDGWPLEISDTAGIRSTTDPIEAEGVRRAKENLRSAQLILVIHDLTQDKPPDGDFELPAGVRCIHVGTKLDRAVGDSLPCHVRTSALTGQGVDVLMESMVKALIPHAPTLGDAVPLDEACVMMLKACVQAIEAGQLDAAKAQLRDVLGR